MKKRILFVINTLSKAGAEVAFLELLRALDPAQYEMDLYVLLEQGELITSVPEHVRILNTRYSRASVLSREGKGFLVRTVLRAFFRRGTGFRLLPYMLANGARMLRGGNVRSEDLLWRLLSDGAPRLWSGEDAEYDLAAAFLEGGSTYFVADHTCARRRAAFVHVDYVRAGYTRELDHGCYERIDRIFPISDEVRGSFLQVHPEAEGRTEVFHNLIDQERIRALAAEDEDPFGDGYEGVRLLTVGRLTPQKGYDFAIDVMRELKKRGTNARWYVLGDGKLRESLQRQIDGAGLSEDFRLLGARDNPYPYMAACDLYVHLTRFEGRSIALQEAMTLGCAVLASDCSGNREQVQSGVNGLLCPLEVVAAADAAERLAGDESLRRRLGEEAARQTYASAEEVGKLLAVLEPDRE